jgi:hypothetical protein
MYILPPSELALDQVSRGRNYLVGTSVWLTFKAKKKQYDSQREFHQSAPFCVGAILGLFKN